MKTQRDFPLELLIELVGNQDLEGRLTLTKAHRGFYVDIDLIFKESKKIFRHLAQVGPYGEFEEARDQAVQRLSFELREMTRQKTTL